MTGMTPASFRAVADLYVAGQCDQHIDAGRLHLVAPPVGRTTAADIWVEMPAEKASSRVSDTEAGGNQAAAGFGIGAIVGGGAAGALIAAGVFGAVTFGVGAAIVAGAAALVGGIGAAIGWLARPTKEAPEPQAAACKRLMAETDSAAKICVTSALSSSKMENWSVEVRGIIGEMAPLARASVRSSDESVKAYVGAVKAGLSAISSKGNGAAIPAIVAAIAPASLDDNTLSQAMIALAKGSGDLEMANIVYAAYYAQKAAAETDPAKKNPMIDAALKAIDPYKGGNVSGGPEGVRARMIAHIEGMVRGKRAKVPEAKAAAKKSCGQPPPELTAAEWSDANLKKQYQDRLNAWRKCTGRK